MSTQAKTATTVKTATQLPPVPETILKRRKRHEANVAADKRRSFKLKKARTVKRRTIFKRAESYANEYKKLQDQERNLSKQAQANGNFYVPPQPKVLLVIRIRGINQMHPKPKKILQLLRLRQINNATFLKVNTATAHMLRLVEPYVTFGAPSISTIRKLVYKRGYAKINRQRTPITENSIIEKALGKLGMICIEDVIHEIATVGPHFKEANNFLWPFKLKAPLGGWKRVLISVTEGGDFGNREETINKLVARMI
jgi:60S ribosomal protein uL30